MSSFIRFPVVKIIYVVKKESMNFDTVKDIELGISNRFSPKVPSKPLYNPEPFPHLLFSICSTIILFILLLYFPIKLFTLINKPSKPPQISQNARPKYPHHLHSYLRSLFIPYSPVILLWQRWRRQPKRWQQWPERPQRRCQ